MKGRHFIRNHISAVSILIFIVAAGRILGPRWPVRGRPAGIRARGMRKSVGNNIGTYAVYMEQCRRGLGHHGRLAANEGTFA